MTNTASPLMANLLARIYLISLEDIFGLSGAESVLYYAGFRHLIKHYPPPTTDRAFPFRDIASIVHAMSIIYGEPALPALLSRAGYYSFQLLVQAQPSRLFSMLQVPPMVSLPKAIGLSRDLQRLSAPSPRQPLP